MARDGERGQGDWKARRGSRNSGGPYAGGAGDTGPVDIAAVRRDDALIDAIASDGPVSTDSAEEYQLASLLANWRAELIAEPLPSEPDLDAVVAAVNQEIGARQVRMNAQSGGRLRLLRPIAGTAAALALVIGGMTAFSYNAEPGDPLWRVKEVVFSEQAQTTVVQRADNDLTAAQALIDQGNPEQARARLSQASVNATQVDDSEKRDDLMARWNTILAELQKVAPDIAKELSTTVPQPMPSRPSGGPGSSVTVRPTTPGSGSTGPTILGTPPGNPGAGGSTTAPDSTTSPTNPPTTTPPTAEPSTTVPEPTTAVPTTISTPTVVVPTVLPGFPGLPTQVPSTGGNTSTVVIPTETTGSGN